MFEKLVIQNRSYRRFQENHIIDVSILKQLISLARCCPSGSNMQPLKYLLCNHPKINQNIFKHLKWAGYLKDWSCPAPGERPCAYILVLGDTEIKKDFSTDAGIQAQTLLLGAAELELGGCMVGSIDRAGLRRDLDIPERYEIVLVIALGKPAETVVLENVGADGDIKYYRDEKNVHHVPKRTLPELIWKVIQK